MNYIVFCWIYFFLIITDHFFTGKIIDHPDRRKKYMTIYWMYIIYSLVFAIGISIWHI